MEKIRIGFLPSHRNIFSRDWAVKMKERTLETLSKIGFIEVITPTPKITSNGLIEDEEDARKTIKLFLESKIDALLIGTMTFGEELPVLSVAEVFKDKPILLFGTKEGPFTDNGCRSSDSFCGTLSISSGLHRRNIPFLFLGIIFPEENIFTDKILSFAQTCNAIKGFRKTKVGLIGPRPYPFETCTINEANLVSKFGIRVVPVSLLAVSEEMDKVKDNEKKVKDIIDEIKSKADCSLIKDSNLIKLAKMEIVLLRYIMKENLSSLALSCWSDIPNILGISPCLVASRLTERGVPVACEADIYGALTMLAQYLMSFGNNVPHFVDWTIQNQVEENLFLSWHCGNAPMCLAGNSKKIAVKENSVSSAEYGRENTEGTVELQLKSGEVSLNRLVEYNGKFKMLITNGKVENRSMELRGSWSWVRVNDLQKLYEKLVVEGFVHHVSMVYKNYSEPMIDFCERLKIEKIII